jgi:predicted ATPase
MVFLLALLPYKKDYARIEDEKGAKHIEEMIYDTYHDLGYDVIRIPVLPVKDRSKLILEKLKLETS